MTKNILIVDDQPEIAELLKLYLEKEGFYIFEAHDGSEAMNIINTHKIDLLLVDLMMPIIDGYQLIKKVREALELPIIIISAKNEDHDKILGLGLGADDFVQKPFNPLEVVARVQALLRRSYQYKSLLVEQNNVTESRRKVVGELILDEDTFSLIHKDDVIALTKIEFYILDLLMDKPGRVFTKQQIFEKAWNEYYMGGEEDNTINVHISKIREKIEGNPKKPIYIKTVRGLGYKFEKDTNY
ncbi:response regulator transcription factor [Metabacillus litoralis]|uniref:Response regulator transcription factor n=1 Tax=Metabacillus litoralis TaxID=152268 RepID=A0A5C6W938_9BACI|nr:response regulator transcription factor [Metabacillus litoralis]TXC92958.1 response regulator transcription factor [Metabacillus litoralis]